MADRFHAANLQGQGLLGGEGDRHQVLRSAAVVARSSGHGGDHGESNQLQGYIMAMGWTPFKWIRKRVDQEFFFFSPIFWALICWILVETSKTKQQQGHHS